MVESQVLQGSVQVRVNTTVVRSSSILPSLASKEDRVVKVDPVWGREPEEKPLTERPMAELTKTPSILRVLLETEEQFPTKLRKLLQLRVVTVK